MYTLQLSRHGRGDGASLWFRPLNSKNTPSVMQKWTDGELRDHEAARTVYDAIRRAVLPNLAAGVSTRWWFNDVAEAARAFVLASDYITLDAMAAEAVR
jgi:hypothetical protein